MSHRSVKQGSPSVPRDVAQLRAAVARRYRLMSTAAAAYDDGDDDQIVVLAALLRGLLTDRQIDHVTPLDSLMFTDSADRLPDGAHHGYGYGLTRIQAYDGMMTGGRIIAPLGGAYRHQSPPTTPFAKWWSEDLVLFPTGREFRTREYVVYEMANTDAIHVDPELDEDYDALTRDNHGFKINDIEVTGNLASAAVRQIVWETQHTLHRAVPDLCPSGFPDVSDELDGHTLLRVAATAKSGDKAQ